MSLVDLRWLRRSGPRERWEGLRPPPARPDALWQDLQWHRALYREDGLDPRTQAAFLGLRVVQRLAYNLGWHAGRRR